jgi:hypothetical protein
MAQDPFLTEGTAYNRLYEEYKTHGSLVIGVDFDGTLNDYHREGHSYPRLHQLLRDLKAINCKIIVWTAYPDLSYVLKFMKENDLPCDGVNIDGIPLPWGSRKPFYSALLDDRAGLREVYSNLDMLAYTILNDKK